MAASTVVLAVEAWYKVDSQHRCTDSIGSPYTIDGHFWRCSKLALPWRVFSQEFHCWHIQQDYVLGPAKK
eukprot:2332729-Rhodomonas_salina.1